MNNKKAGYLSIEYIILASIIGAFCLILFFVQMPKSSRKPINVAGNEIVAVIGNNEEGHIGGGGSIISPTPEPTPSSDFDCVELDSNTCSIRAYYGSETGIVIPSSINSKQVVEIADNAFMNKNLTSVVLPATVTKIGSNAFANNKLTSINLQFVKQIGNSAFVRNLLVSVNTGNIEDIAAGAFMNNQIQVVTLGKKVKTIRENAFANNKIKTVTLPSEVVMIEKQGFYNNEIRSVHINEKLESMQAGAFGFQNIEEGIVFIDGEYNRFDEFWSSYFDSKYRKEAREEFRYTKLSGNTCSITAYLGNSTDLVVPQEIDGLTVVDIADETFANRRLTSVVLPTTLQSIGKSAFENNQLSKVVLPKSVRVIKDYAFSGNGIKSADIKGNLTTLGISAFASQDVVNGTVILTNDTVNRFGLTNETNWQKYFDKKLQKGR